jgi:Arc/MetJ family transcription regulator
MSKANLPTEDETPLSVEEPQASYGTSKPSFEAAMAIIHAADLSTQLRITEALVAEFSEQIGVKSTRTKKETVQKALEDSVDKGLNSAENQAILKERFAENEKVIVIDAPNAFEEFMRQMKGN